MVMLTNAHPTHWYPTSHRGSSDTLGGKGYDERGWQMGLRTWDHPT